MLGSEPDSTQCGPLLPDLPIRRIRQGLGTRETIKLGHPATSLHGVGAHIPLVGVLTYLALSNQAGQPRRAGLPEG